MLGGLTGCAAVAPHYNTPIARRYDAPYCDGLARFYWANAVDTTRFSASSPQLLSAFLGYNIETASAHQVNAVRRQLTGCEIYYADLQRPGGPDLLANLYTRYRAGRDRAVIRRLLAVLPYRAPEPRPHPVFAAPAAPTPSEVPRAPIERPKPTHHKVVPTAATIAPPPPIPPPPAPTKVASPGCSSPKTVSALLASYRTYYGQNIAELQHYRTITAKAGTKFTYCSAYAIIPNDSHTIDYKFTTTPNGTVKVFPVSTANP